MKPTDSDHGLLKALWRQPHDGVPVWFMRQAGRYLPGYQKVRSQVDFLTLCRTPDLAAEVTLEPLELFGVDAVIIFSDILVPLEAMGLEVVFTDAGPCMGTPLAGRADIEALADPDPETDIGYVMDVVREVRRRVDGRVPVIGFAGAPFTMACYALEGSPKRTFGAVMSLAYREPETLHLLLDRLATCIGRYLRAQIAAGAEAIQLFDTWGGMLAHDAFHEFSLPYCERILRELDGLDVPRLLFIKGGGQQLDAIVGTGVEGVAIDATVDPRDALRIVDGRAAIQGNLAPEALFAPEDDLRRRVRGILDVLGRQDGYIFNLGHGILPPTRIDSVRAVVEEVRAFQPASP